MNLIQIKKRRAAGPLPDDLSDAVWAALLVDPPDPEALQERIAGELGASPEQARRILYRLVASIHARMFPPITHLEIIHTEGCNLGCAYCFEKEMLGWRRMRPEIARGAVDLLFEYAREAPVLTIVHFGGEPTLNLPGIRLVTEYAEERAAQAGKTVKFNMTSNGVLITEEMAEYFAAHRIMVLLSIDGLQASHDSYRRDKKGRGTFERVIDKLQLLKRTQRWVGAKLTVMPENAHRLFDDVRGLFDLGINQFIIGYATGIDWPRELMETYTEQLGLVYDWYKGRPHDDLRISDFDAPAQGQFYGCQAGKISVTVTVDGEVSPCAKVLAVNSRQLLAKLGDVQYGLTHLKNRYELVSCTKLKQAVAGEGIAGEFHGGCFASNYEANGDLFAPNLQDHLFSVLQRSRCSGCGSSR